ncbi:MAG: HD-GYP domain-containing protein [Solirubrobacteraceae bacterium]
MSFDPTFEEQELLADTVERESSRMDTRERRFAIAVSAVFAGAVTGLWLLQPPRAFAIGPALVCLAVLVLATLVRFDTPFGCTRATQLGVVPLLFAVPVAVVPIAVAIAMAIAWLPDVRAGGLRPARLLHIPANACFVIGPAAVLAVAGTQPSDAGPALLLAALAAQFVADFIVSSARILILPGATVASVLRATWIYAIDAALSCIALVVAEDIHSTPSAPLALVPLLGLLAVFAHERHRRLQSMLELSSAYRGTALVLGDVIEADDGYTGEHCRSVVSLALEIAEHLGLTAERRRNLEFAALLHDVGKIAIPKEIINKPGKLDESEWEIIKTHTLEGQRILERVGGLMSEIGQIVRSSHERWDGKGYPDGLIGEAIPLEARIVSVCDAFNAMTTSRSYRAAMSDTAAIDELNANAGTQFDPDVVEALIELVAEPATSLQTSSRTELGAELIADTRPAIP